VSANSESLVYLDLLEVGERIRRRELTAVMVTETQLARMDDLEPALRSYAHVMAQSALEAAARADAELEAGRVRGPLHGVPLAVKDLFWTRDAPTAGGTVIHSDFRAPVDATAVARLREAGAILLGKLKMTEGAYSDYHPSIEPPQNPWDADYWPGISSSGPGVALAAGLCFGALASDTGGSIRWPCGANGVTGLKPTWGRISRHGTLALAPTMDHVGVMARSVADVAALLAAVAGPDPADPTALQPPPENYSATITSDMRGVRIGIDRAWTRRNVDTQVVRVLDEAEDIFRELGADIVELALPDATRVVTDWSPVCAVEAAVTHRDTYPARAESYGSVLKEVIEAGRALSAMDYQELQLRRMTFRGQMTECLVSVDLLLVPVHPFPPLSLEALGVMGERPELIARLQTFTAPFDLTGHPALTLPGGFDGKGMPIGFQLIAADLAEGILLKAGAAFQRASSWHRRRPRHSDYAALARD